MIKKNTYQKKNIVLLIILEALGVFLVLFGDNSIDDIRYSLLGSTFYESNYYTMNRIQWTQNFLAYISYSFIYYDFFFFVHTDWMAFVTSFLQLNAEEL